MKDLSPELRSDMFRLAHKVLFGSIYDEVVRGLNQHDANDRARAIRVLDALGFDGKGCEERCYADNLEFKAKRDAFQAQLEAVKAGAA